jgi:hypothetical protein
MVTPVSSHLSLAPALEPACTAPLGPAGEGSAAVASPPAEHSSAPGADDPANLYLLAVAHYGNAPERSGVTLAAVLNALGSDGV